MPDLKFTLSNNLISATENPKIESILVLGGSDTGKTTLIESLIRILQDRFSLGVVDCDIGQSHIGPPTTIAWTRIKKEITGLQDLEMEDFYFVGSTSPSGNISRCLEGTDLIFKRAKHLSDKVLIDTSGYIHTQEAVDFKIKKIRSLKPDVIIALQREAELEQILKDIKVTFVFRIAVPAGVREKSLVQRALFRQMRFKEYFFSASEVGFAKGLFTNLNEQDDFTDGLVCLRNSSGEHLALGVIKKRAENNIYLLTPLKESEVVSSIIIGMYKWQGL